MVTYYKPFVCVGKVTKVMGDVTSRAVGIQTGHVGINVTDLTRSVQFYSGILGLQVLKESEASGRRYAFLGTGRKTVLTLWEQAEGRFDKAAPGLHHLSFSVEGVEAVREVERRLMGAGATLIYTGVVPHSEGSDSGGIFFEDPDGTRLEVFSQTGAASEAAPVAGAPSCGFY